ncbi:hypothetical protein R1flu_003762 [Riccia fluitans]|uniref:Uncharacterized protein n=1 Tax=Riccia fluitans TaxID=41844 RepID=A0ABD1YCY3_9MARC
MRPARSSTNDEGFAVVFKLVAKKDRRLADLGAEPVVPKGLGDDQHRSCTASLARRLDGTSESMDYAGNCLRHAETTLIESEGGE